MIVDVSAATKQLLYSHLQISKWTERIIALTQIWFNNPEDLHFIYQTITLSEKANSYTWFDVQGPTINTYWKIKGKAISNLV